MPDTASANPMVEPRVPPWFDSAPSDYASELQNMLTVGRLDDPSIARMRDEEVEEKCMRDPTFSKAANVLAHTISGRDWYLQAKTESAKKAKPYVEDILDMCENFDEARLILAQGTALSGLRWAKIEGEWVTARFGTDIVARQWWIPKFLIDVDKRSMRLEGRIEEWVDANGTVGKRPRFQWVIRDITDQGRERVVTNPEQFVRHTYQAAERTWGHGRGMLDSAFAVIRVKTRAFEYLAQGLERFGYPWIHAALDPGNISSLIGSNFPTRQARMDALLAALIRMRKSQVIITSPEDKITPLDLGGQGNKVILDAIMYCDKQIVELLLGSSMPTGGGQQGSFARAEVEKETTNEVTEFHRLSLANTITRDLISAIMRYNAHNFRELGIATNASPKFRIGREHGNDYLLNIARLERLKAAGLPTTGESWYDFAGVEAPDEFPKIIPGDEPGMAAGAPPADMAAAFQQLAKAIHFQQQDRARREGNLHVINDSTGVPIFQGAA